MVRVGGDINGIELDPGDTIDVDGNTWTYQSDGTLSGPALETDEARIGASADFGPGDQNLVSNGAVTVSVPGDYATPQEAVNAVAPLLNRHRVTIDIGDGEDFSSTDLVIPATIQGQTPAGNEVATIRIVGDQSKSNMPTLKSVYVCGGNGVSAVSVVGVTITGVSELTSDIADENAGVLAFGSGVTVADCDFTDPGTTGIPVGVRSYDSTVKIQGNCDFGTGRSYWGVTKRGGTLFAKDGTLTGNATEGRAFASGTGTVYIEPSSIDDTNLTKIAKETAGGLVIDEEARALYEPTLTDGTTVKGGTGGQFSVENSDTATTKGQAVIEVNDSGDTVFRDDQAPNNWLRYGDRIEVQADLDFNSHPWFNPPATETADGMTADPETAAEDGYISVTISGTPYQIPIYQA